MSDGTLGTNSETGMDMLWGTLGGPMGMDTELDKVARWDMGLGTEIGQDHTAGFDCSSRMHMAEGIFEYNSPEG